MKLINCEHSFFFYTVINKLQHDDGILIERPVTIDRDKFKFIISAINKPLKESLLYYILFWNLEKCFCKSWFLLSYLKDDPVGIGRRIRSNKVSKNCSDYCEGDDDERNDSAFIFLKSFPDCVLR